MSNPQRLSALLFALVSLIAAVAITRLVQAPDFTDAFYHFNAAHRLVRGDGLTDPYLWVYIGAPESLAQGASVPSHTYWMPLTSLSAAFGMWLLNAPGNYAAAQLLFVLMLAGTGGVGYWLGGKLGGTRRAAWVAGLLTLASPFYLRWWGTIDTFAPYAFVGSLALVCIGLGIERRDARWFAFGGVMSGLCHLTRADGLLLLGVGIAVALWPARWSRRAMPQAEPSPNRQKATWIVALVIGYFLVMLPWFGRNLSLTGSPLPLGGSQGIWFTEYNDLFSYPADASPQTLFAEGMGLFFDSRWTALTNGLQTFIAVEGAIFITPLMLIGFWKLRRSSFVRGFWLAALGIHLAMTIIFPYPGYRGGLFHSAAALIPWWMAFGVVGLDAVIDWVAKRLPHWNPPIAKRTFSVLLVGGTVLLSVTFAFQRGVIRENRPSIYNALTAALPADARVMINDPAALYYYTGISGVVQPNETPQVILEIAERYQVTHLLIENVAFYENGLVGAAAPTPLIDIITNPPEFLILVEDFPVQNARLYEIRR